MASLLSLSACQKDPQSANRSTVLPQTAGGSGGLLTSAANPAITYAGNYTSAKKDSELHRLRAEQSEKELSNSTLQLVAQTELLSELRDGILGIARRFPLPDGAAKELRERLKVLPCKSVDWKKFDTQFKAAHPEFAKKLLEKFPKLTPTEVRICSLLRMNLRSAEIARLFCLSERTIEHHRANVRTKLKLKTSDDLMKILAMM